jgi:acylglycerol lipase
LNAAGYICYSFDHHGHGQSEGKREQVNKSTQFIEDIKQYFDSIKAKHPDKKIFILGHSMGSVISLHFVYTYPNAIDALIVTGTATDVSSTVAKPLRTIADFLYRFVPHAPISPPMTDPSILTREKKFQQEWLDDPLVYRGWTLISIAKYIIDTGEMLQDNARKMTLPILIMHGEADELTPISGSRIMAKQIGSDDKTLKTWADMKHEIMNEIGREEVLATIVEWFNQH